MPFPGTIKDAERAIGMGFKLGIGGIVTFKNSGLDKIVKEIGPENLILETDSPYLAPVPYRGKRNESSYICIINKKLAEIFGMSEEEIASITFIKLNPAFQSLEEVMKNKKEISILIIYTGGTIGMVHDPQPDHWYQLTSGIFQIMFLNSGNSVMTFIQYLSIR